MLVAAQVVTAVLGMATLLVVSRLLGPTALGEWRFAVAVTGYLLIVSDAGLSAFAVREIARERTLTPRLGWPVVVVQAAVAGVLYALLIGGLLLSGMSGRAFAVVALLGLSAFVHALGIGHVFQAYERMSTIALVSVASPSPRRRRPGRARGDATARRGSPSCRSPSVSSRTSCCSARPALVRRSRSTLPTRARSARAPSLGRAVPRRGHRDAAHLQRRRDPDRDLPRRARLGIYAAGYAIPAQLLVSPGR